MFEAVAKQSLSEAVYDQLRARILNRDIEAGAELPSERILCEMLGVNRGAVREGIKRLQQAGLVQVRHGGPTVVLDFEQEAGLEMLPALLVDEEGNMRVEIARGIISLRQNLAPEVARLAAGQKQREQTADRLEALLSELHAGQDLCELQDQVFEYWNVLVNGSGNIAYRLAFNSLRKTYKKIWGLLTNTLSDEFRDIERLHRLADAVRRGDADAAHALASEYVALGTQAMQALLDAYAADKSGAGKITELE